MKKTVEKEVKKELKEAFVLWKNEGKTGEYLSGFTTFDPVKKEKLVGFFNSKKKNPNEPDIRVYYVKDDGSRGEEAVSLWEETSQNGTRYLTGTTDDKERIIAFYGKEHQEMRPHIRAYFKD